MDDRKELHLKQLGERLRTARRQAGYTQQQVAEALGIGRSTIATWETGQNDVDSATLRRLAELYGTSTDALLGVESRARQEVGGVPPSPAVVANDLLERLMRVLEDLAAHLREREEMERLRIERVEALRAEAEVERERSLKRLLELLMGDDACARDEGRSDQPDDVATEDAGIVTGRP